MDGCPHDLDGLAREGRVEVACELAVTVADQKTQRRCVLMPVVLNDAELSIASGRVVIVVNERRDLYLEILERFGLRLDERHRRHVNRRTGRRACEFFEDVLVPRV
jgi:hypothetical protein